MQFRLQHLINYIASGLTRNAYLSHGALDYQAGIIICDTKWGQLLFC